MFKKNLEITTSFYLLTFILLISLAYSECTNKPSCFKKKLFNFDYPKQRLYQISINQNQNTQYQVKAYGDFNNDLNTDFIALNQQFQAEIYVWNKDSVFYERVATISNVQNCIPSNLYLYDINQDGYLDFTIWGYLLSPEEIITNNCIIPFIRIPSNNSSSYVFQNTTFYLTQPTTQPILFTFPFQNNFESISLMLFLNGSRSILKYKSISVSYQVIPWSSLFDPAYTSIGFYSIHWNTYVDLTGDCRSDLVIYNINQQIQIWINIGKSFNFLNNPINYPNLKSLTFNDINYDGAPDLILANSTFIISYLNTKTPDSTNFCCQNCQSFNLDYGKPIYIQVQSGQTIKQQYLHFIDLNIDGFPDLSLILTSETGQTTTPTVYMNNLLNSNSFGLFEQYNTVIQQVTKGFSTLSISHIDILQNGIIDFMVVIKNATTTSTISFYNNYLYQNYFFIKGFGVSGPQNNQGVQFPGLTFYWINSVNDGERITYQSQITQTAYDSLQMPYAFCGLGRANNYVQSFTIGKNGQKRMWSPIIPNSQLGVFTVNGQSSEWVIRIFVLPTQSLVYVIIVSILILGILGLILLYFKCKMYRKKPQSPLMMQFIS